MDISIFLSSDRSHDFTASRGWLENLLRRRNFTLGCRTTVSKRLPLNLVPRVVHFVLTTRKLVQKKSYALSSIGNNTDETPLWLDMPGDTTISRVGERSVSVKTTGHEKSHFTVAFAAMADGRRLKPFVVFKGVSGLHLEIVPRGGKTCL